MISGALARAGVTVVGAYLFSRVLGWLRLVVIGNLFGAGPDLDAYFAAFRIPDLIYQLVAAGAISSALVPVLAGLLHAGEDDRARRVVSTVINAMLLTLTAFALVMAIFAPQVMPILVPGFDAATTTVTVHLTRIMLIAPVLLALGAVCSAVLNTQGRFGAAAIAPLLYNLAIIGSALLLSPSLGVDALAVGVVGGALLHVAVQVPRLRRWFRYRLVLDLGDAAARRILRLMGPRALGLAANQVMFIVNTALATTVAVGAVTIYTIAFTIFVIPVGVIGMPMGIVLLPMMSRALAAGEVASFGSLIVTALRLLVWVMLFLAVVGIVLSRQVVGLLFGGAFDSAALELSAQALSIFLLGLTGNALTVLLARAFFSDQDTTTPLQGVLLAVAVTVSVGVATVGTFGLHGLAAAAVVGDTSEAAFLMWRLRRRVPTVPLGSLVRVVPLIAAGAVLCGLVALGTLRASEALLGADPGRLALLVQIVVTTAAGGALYLLYTRLVGLPELSRAFGLLRTSLRERDREA